MDLNNKTAIVTGASQGIGAAILEAFAKEGCNTVLAYRNNKEGAEKIAKHLRAKNKSVELFQGDLSNEKVAQELISFTSDRFNSVDILVNNAGKSEPKSLLETSKEDWLNAFNNNFFSTVLCSKYALKYMTENKGGKILNMSSINGLEYVGREGNIAYSAAKAAIINFTKTLAKEYAPKILVNAVAPGLTKTEYWDRVDEKFKDRAKNGIPIKRFIKREEIADVYVFLAKNDSLTGELIVADGGFNLKDYS